MVEDKNSFDFYNKSYRVAEEPLYDPDLDPKPEPQTCSKCDQVAEYVYDGDPLCSDHLPKEAEEVATEVR